MQPKTRTFRPSIWRILLFSDLRLAMLISFVILFLIGVLFPDLSLWLAAGVFAVTLLIGLALLSKRVNYYTITFSEDLQRVTGPSGRGRFQQVTLALEHVDWGKPTQSGWQDRMDGRWRITTRSGSQMIIWARIYSNASIQAIYAHLGLEPDAA